MPCRCREIMIDDDTARMTERSLRNVSGDVNRRRVHCNRKSRDSSPFCDWLSDKGEEQ